MKRQFGLVSVFLIVAVLACRYRDNSPAHKEGPPPGPVATVDTAQMAKAYRETLNGCIKCHAKEYQNELRGPHWRAYADLKEHHAFVESAAYHSAGYKKFVEANYAFCQRCHAPQPLFEQTFKGLDTSKEMASAHADWMKTVSDFPVLRAVNHNSGIDCISCHSAQQGVVTNAGFKHTPSQMIKCTCNPAGSAFFTSNFKCGTCHKDAVRTLVPTLGGLAIEQSCMGCHEEHINGKPTHLMYTNSDTAAGSNLLIAKFFDDIKVSYNEKQKAVEVHWQNTCMPHIMNESCEFQANISIICNNEVIGEKSVRLNRKDFHDTVTLRQSYGTEKVPGVHGDTVSIHGQPLVYTIPLSPNKSGKLKVHITGSFKEQYWFPDEFEKKEFDKYLAL